MTAFDKRGYYRQMLAIAIPIVIQHVVGIGLNLVDNLMIGRLGEGAVAAVGSANQVYFLFTMTCFGLCSGTAVFVAQYWGAGDKRKIHKILGMDYILITATGILFSVLGFAFAPRIIAVFDDSRQVIKLGTDYLRIVCFSYVLTGLSNGMNFNSRAVQNLKIPTIINALALMVNTVLNYCLIYGHSGMPALGVKGAAVATVIARALEFACLVSYIYSDSRHPLYAKPDELFSFKREDFKVIMKTALPVVVTENVWSVSTSVIFAIYGHLGTTALAVTQVANTISEFMQSFYFGVGNAGAVLVGKELGRKNTMLAYEESKINIKLVWILNILAVVTLIPLRPYIASVYRFNAETTALLSSVIAVWAFVLTPKMLGYIYSCGILRPGGDTVFTMKTDFAYNFVLQVILAFSAVYIFDLPLPQAMIFVAIGDVLRCVHSHIRFKSRKWMNIMTGF